MKLEDCQTIDDKINWYAYACIGYLKKYKENHSAINELGKAESCINKINKLEHEKELNNG